MSATPRLLLMLAIPAVFYVLATFFNSKFQIQSYSSALLISVLFATAEYALKNPIVDRLSESLSYPIIQSVWILQTIALSALFQQMRFGD